MKKDYHLNIIENSIKETCKILNCHYLTGECECNLNLVEKLECIVFCVENSTKNICKDLDCHYLSTECDCNLNIDEKLGCIISHKEGD